jgi:hypothetical protein
VQSPKKFNVHLCTPFILSCFEASAAPRPENSDTDEKDALFGLDTQITILVLTASGLFSYKILSLLQKQMK